MGPRYDGVRGVHPAQLKHPDRRRGPGGSGEGEPQLHVSHLTAGQA